MSRFLSVLLPLCDAQSRIEDLVQRTLEVVPELTPRFEIVLIDNASRDETADIAHSLAARYPQVGVVHLGAPQGPAGTFRAGLVRAQGELVVLRPDRCRAAIEEIAKLWRKIDGYDVVFGLPVQTENAAPRWARRLTGAPPAGTRRRVPLVMAHRDVADEIPWHFADAREFRQLLTQRGLTWAEVSLREVAAAGGAGQFAVRTAALKDPVLRRPNYLSRLKRFALGK